MKEDKENICNYQTCKLSSNGLLLPCFQWFSTYIINRFPSFKSYKQWKTFLKVLNEKFSDDYHLALVKFSEIQIKQIEKWSQSFSILSDTRIYHIIILWDNSEHSPWYKFRFFVFAFFNIISHVRNAPLLIGCLISFKKCRKSLL